MLMRVHLLFPWDGDTMLYVYFSSFLEMETRCCVDVCTLLFLEMETRCCVNVCTPPLSLRWRHDVVLMCVLLLYPWDGGTILC